MTTNLDNIPLKTNKNNEVNNDDSDDPIVKDILNEFQQELELNTRKTQSPPPQQPINNYQVNMPPSQDPQDNQNKLLTIPKKKNGINNQNSYYNQIYVNKTIIIIIIVALIFSPLLFPILIQKIPASMVDTVQEYNFYIKLGLLFISIYLLYFYNYL
jgi:hypothetical protein